MLNYNYSGVNYLSANDSVGSRSDYVNLRPGANVGPWRVRNYTTWYRDGKGQDTWNTVYTYVQRAIVPLKSVMLAGDGVAPSDVFDSIPFRGMQLTSDEDMYPESVRGYAPVVRGIARTKIAITPCRKRWIPGPGMRTLIYPNGVKTVLKPP